jgi:protein-tyrosine phosphatase
LPQRIERIANNSSVICWNFRQPVARTRSGPYDYPRLLPRDVVLVSLCPIFVERRWVVAAIEGTEMFRRVALPADLPGQLLLHSMPGRFEALDKFWHQLKSEAVGAIVCLTEAHEIRLKSWRYAEALESGTVPCTVLPFEIREGGIPEDRSAFWTLAKDIAARLRGGESVLVHCAGGVGRTAMLAVSVLLALGHTIAEAESAISQAGSIVETMPQVEMLSWCAAQCAAGKL